MNEYTKGMPITSVLWCIEVVQGYKDWGSQKMQAFITSLLPDREEQK